MKDRYTTCGCDTCGRIFTGLQVLYHCPQATSPKHPVEINRCFDCAKSSRPNPDADDSTLDVDDIDALDAAFKSSPETSYRPYHPGTILNEAERAYTWVHSGKKG